MKKSLEILESQLAAIKATEKSARKARRKVSAIRQSLVNYWCQSFAVESCEKQIITMMFDRLCWIDIRTMFDLIDICARKVHGQSQYSAYRYMAGIMKRHLAQLGIDFSKAIETGGVE